MSPTRRLGVFLASLAMAVSLWPATADAERRRAPVKRGVVVFVGGYFYDPFYGPYPWWPRVAWPYPYYPMFDDHADIRLAVTPKEAAVYVDGYYAGIVDDFDGVFQRLALPPGPHEIVFYLEGFRTARQRLYLSPGSESKLRETMERLAPGERSEPPSLGPAVPPPPPGTARAPRTPPRAVPADTPVVAPFGTLAIQVQPSDAEVFIDGERWVSSGTGEPLLVQVAEGMHDIEIRRPGYRGYASGIEVRAGATTPLNVSLSETAP